MVQVEKERHGYLMEQPYQSLMAMRKLVKPYNWDALTRPIIAEHAGSVSLENIEEGVTVANQIDEITGVSTLVVIDRSRGHHL